MQYKNLEVNQTVLECLFSKDESDTLLPFNESVKELEESRRLLGINEKGLLIEPYLPLKSVESFQREYLRRLENRF